MNRKVKKLLDFYRNPRKAGIFFYMSQNPLFNELFAKLGLNSDNSIHGMDFDYMFNHSGLKTVSVMLEQIMYGYIVDDSGNYVYTPENKKVTWDYALLEIDQDLINSVIATKFLDKWNNLADTLTLDYDPLNPFSMEVIEDTTDKLDSINNSNNHRTTTRNSSDKNNYTDNVNGKTNNTTDDSVYGFNSENASPSDSSLSSFTNTGTNDGTSNNTYEGTDNSSYQSSDEYNRNNTKNRQTSRKGNIGNLSAQQLIEQQRELLRYQIFDTIYNDLDSVLTRSKYY